MVMMGSFDIKLEQSASRDDNGYAVIIPVLPIVSVTVLAKVAPMVLAANIWDVSNGEDGVIDAKPLVSVAVIAMEVPYVVIVGIVLVVPMVYLYIIVGMSRFMIHSMISVVVVLVASSTT